MSDTATGDRERDRALGGAYRPYLRTAGRAVFGDRLGLVLFLCALMLLVATWRVGAFITDTRALANTFVAVADGQLHLQRSPYGPLSVTYEGTRYFAPGLYEVDGRIYGRNYGQHVLTLPLLWLLQGLAAVVNPRLAVVAGWSLLPVAVAWHLGRHWGRVRETLRPGLAVGLLLLVANLAVRLRPLPADQLYIAAMQLSAMVAAAAAAVVCYRLLGGLHGRRTGLLGGAGVLLATPLSFWGTIPKRHVFVSAFVLTALYALYRSRQPGATLKGDPLLGHAGYRALAYVAVGMVTWIHAVEGFLLFVALVTVDLPTAPRNDRRTLAVVGVAFALSMLPFLITNALIFGSPIVPPRFHGGADQVSVGPAGTVPDEAPSAGTPRGGGQTDGGAGQPTVESPGEEPTGPTFLSRLEKLLSPLIEAVERATALLSPLTALLGVYGRSLAVLLNSPADIYHTFVRSGELFEPKGVFMQPGTNLTMLESAPVVGAVAAVPTVLVGRVSGGHRTLREVVDARPVDHVAAIFAALLVGLYISRLPIHAQLTVRYLLPVYPLAVYATLRVGAVRAALDEYDRALLWSYLTTALVASVAFPLVTAVYGLGKGGAFQMHARVALLAAGLAAVAAVTTTARGRGGWLLAVALGIAAGLATAFLLDTSFVYMHYAGSALPAVEGVSGWIRKELIRITLGA